MSTSARGRLARRALGAAALALACVPSGLVGAQVQPPTQLRPAVGAVLVVPTELRVSGMVVANSNPEVCRDSGRRVGARLSRTVPVQASGESVSIGGVTPMDGSGGRARTISGALYSSGTFEITSAPDAPVVTRWTGAFGAHGSGYAQATEITSAGGGCTVEWELTFLPSSEGAETMEEIEGWRPVEWPDAAADCGPDPRGGLILATALEDRGSTRALYRTAANGLCVTRLGTVQGAPFFTGISPDGQHALFGVFIGGTATEWHRVSLLDGATTRLAGNAYTWPVWNADGQPVTVRVPYTAMGLHPWGQLASVAAPDWSLLAMAWNVFGTASRSAGILVVDTRTGTTVTTIGAPPAVCAVTPPPQTETCNSGAVYEPLGFWPEQNLLFYRTGGGGSNLGWSAIEAVRLDGSGEVVYRAGVRDGSPGSTMEWHLRAVFNQSDPPPLVLSAAGPKFLAPVPRGAGFDLLSIAPHLNESLRLVRTPARLQPVAYLPPAEKMLPLPEMSEMSEVPGVEP